MRNSFVLVISAIAVFMVCACETKKIECPDGQTECEGECYNLQTDDNHCGNCDTACQDGFFCDSGQCADEDCGDVGDDCAEHGDCCTNMRCFDGSCDVCVEAEGSCTEHGECCDDMTCDLNGRCIASCSAKDGNCTVNSDCCDPLVCIEDTCQDCIESTQECYETEHCCEGLVCHQGVCGPECGLLNDACSNDEPCCPPLECRNNTCQEMQFTFECNWEAADNPGSGLAVIPGANSSNLGDFEVLRHHGSHATMNSLDGLIYFKTIELLAGTVAAPAGTDDWSEDGTSSCGATYAWEETDGCGLMAEVEGTERTATVADCDNPKLSSDEKLYFNRRVDNDFYVFSLDLSAGSGTDLGVGTPVQLDQDPISLYLEDVSADGSAVLATSSAKAYLSKDGAAFVEIGDCGYSVPDINANGEVITVDDGYDVNAYVLIDEGGSPTWKFINLDVSLWGQSTNNNPGYKEPSVDDQGRFVAFSGSGYTELGLDEYFYLTSQIFVIDLWSGIIELVSKVGDTSVSRDCTNPQISPTGESILFKCDAPELPGADGDFWLYRVDNPLYTERTMTGTECKPIERSCTGNTLDFCPAGESLQADCLAGCYDGPGVARCATFGERVWHEDETLSADLAEVYALMATTPGEYIIEITVDDLPDIRLFVCPADGSDCSFGGTNLGEVDEGGAGETEFFQITFDEPTEFLLVVESANATAGTFDLLVEPPRYCVAGESACEGEDLGVCNAEGNGSTGTVDAVCALPCQAIPFKIGAGCGYIPEGPEPVVPTDAQDIGTPPLDMRTVVEGQLEDASDEVDWFTFSLTEQSLVEIRNVQPLIGDVPFDSYLGLYAGTQDPQDLVAESDNIGNNMDWIFETSLEAGTYYIEVTHCTYFVDERGDYRLQIDVASP